MIVRVAPSIEGKKTAPALVFVKKRAINSITLRFTIHEGRKRQIRYMIKKVGAEVLSLKRLQIGDVRLGKLPLGMWKMLKPSEVISLRNYQRRGNR